MALVKVAQVCAGSKTWYSVSTYIRRLDVGIRSGSPLNFTSCGTLAGLYSAYMTIPSVCGPQ